MNFFGTMPLCANELALTACGNNARRKPNVQWPLKLMRISSISPYFHKADLLIMADCCGFLSVDSNINNRTLVIGCPDGFGIDFYEKIQQIVCLNDIKSVRLIRMESPCCSRMTDAVITAIRSSGKDIPLQITSLFTEGEIVE